MYYLGCRQLLVTFPFPSSVAVLYTTLLYELSQISPGGFSNCASLHHSLSYSRIHKVASENGNIPQLSMLVNSADLFSNQLPPRRTGFSSSTAKRIPTSLLADI